MGLTNDEVINSRKKYGTNEINIKKNHKFIDLFIESLGDPMIKVLLVALVIKIVFLFQDSNYFETIGIIIAILLSTLISSISEYGSNKTFEKLESDISNILVKVKRDNKVKEISINEIVVGDLLILSSGDKIGADGVLISGNLMVDESILNGETKEQKKTIDSLIYRGTTVYFGEGVVKVTKVGINTMYGSIAREINESNPISPLRNRLIDLAKIISRIGYIGAFLVMFAYLYSTIVIANNYDLNLIKNTISNFPIITNYLIYALTLGVTIIVVAVPEGLPMMITLVLSSNMKKMLKSNVLVRKLVGIETSGNINILLTDKTGTLTYGKLEVIKVIGGNLEELSKKEILKSNYYDALYYNNDSYFIDNKKVVGGNSTDRAIMTFLGETNTIKKKIQDKKVFDSSYKYSSATVNNITYYKGASEVIIPNCKKYLKNNKEYLITDNSKINDMLKEATSLGIRVITLAYGNNRDLKDLVFMGLIYLKDDLRSESFDAIKLIKNAGIQTIMITGDSTLTAQSIAREVGIIDSDANLVIDSNTLSNMSDSDIVDKLKDIRVISRALPSDKSRLVRVIEDQGLVVGMTGDGVNDAPALKKANVGFAMGSGTEVAKEASDIVILDNNIASIASAILYGRTIFKSIRKFIIYQLSVNMCALIISIVGPFIGFESPITIVQMLWLNMIMDIFSALAFSYEPALLEYMEELPKKNNEKIINSYMYNEIIVSSLYSALLCILFLKVPSLHMLFRVGENNKFLMTSYFALFIFIGIFNSFNARTYRINIFKDILKNKVFVFIIGFIIIVQVYLIYYGGNLFRTYGLELDELFLIILIATSVWPVDIIRKLILKKFNLKRTV
ncbi:MAG: calcium-translocating P-type ATPase, PMCA-type [Bacilli bacterium]|nr:calcium-translocating P-type ATPase, PMCA-type [Bacilli bacterium]